MALKTFALIYSTAAFFALHPAVNNDGTAYTGGGGTLPTSTNKSCTVTIDTPASSTDPVSGLTFFNTVVSIDTTNLGSIWKPSESSWAVGPALDQSVLADMCEVYIGKVLDQLCLTDFMTFPAGMSHFMTQAEFNTKYPAPTLPTVLPAPTNLVLTPGNNVVHMNWTPVSGAWYYEVYRSTGEGTLGTMIGTPTGTTGVHDTAVSNGTTYYYTLAAIASDCGEGIHGVQTACTPSAGGSGGGGGVSFE